MKDFLWEIYWAPSNFYWWVRRKIETPPMCNNCPHDMGFHTEYDSWGCIACDQEGKHCSRYIEGDPWL